MEEDRTLPEMGESLNSRILSWSTLKPEPWEEVEEGLYCCKFSWNEDKKPPVVDTEGTHLTDENIPLFGGSKCKLASNRNPISLRMV